MASRKSAQITNRDSVPSVFNNSNAGPGSQALNYCGVVSAVATADVSGDVYRMFEVPTNIRVSNVWSFTTGLGGSAAGDIGVYRNTRDGGAVVDADFFGSAVSFVSPSGNSEVTNESGNNSAAKREQPLWQALGLASDPGGTFDICITLTATVGTSNPIGLNLFGAQ